MNEILEIGSGELIEEQDKVQFRLLYEGSLESSGNKRGMGPVKHDIRRAFHPQLRRLWFLNKNLRQLANNRSTPKGMPGEKWTELFTAMFNRTIPPLPTNDERVQMGLKFIGEQWQRVGYDFVPMVTSDMVLRCKIDVLLLRPGEDKHIFRRGDIDGQLKTLIDALKIPENNEDTGCDKPTDDEHPFFCLLQDDRLITELHVITDELLLLPHEKEVKATDAFAVIDVQINHIDARTFDRYF